MRKDAPSWMLGNVHCGSVATGRVWFRNVLTLAFSAFTKVEERAVVQEPSTALNRLLPSWRCVADPIARSIALADVSVLRSPAYRTVTRLAGLPPSTRNDHRPSSSGASAKLRGIVLVA